MIDTCMIAAAIIAAMRPNLRRAGKHGRLQRLAQFRRNDHMAWRDQVEAMRQRRTAKLGVDQCHDTADAGDAEPDRQIIRLVRHQQTHGLGFAELLRERPTRVTVGARHELLIGEGFAVRDQCWRFAVRPRPLRDNVQKQTPRLLGNRRGRFQCPHPALQGAFAAAACGVACFCDPGHGHAGTSPNKVNFSLQD